MGYDDAHRGFLFGVGGYGNVSRYNIGGWHGGMGTSSSHPLGEVPHPRKKNQSCHAIHDHLDKGFPSGEV